MNEPSSPPPGSMHERAHASGCRMVRLAESPAAVIDLCSCGTFQLHIGALTLRLPPHMVSELSSTLERALHEHAAQRMGAAPTSLSSAGRGEA